MRLGSLLTTLAGFAVAGGSAYLAAQHFESQKTANVAKPTVITEQAEMVDVIVAGLDISLGQPIEPHMLTTIAWPRDAAPAGVFSKYEDLLPDPGEPPRRAKRAMSQGEPVLVNKVSDFGEKVTIVQSLGPNLRAMAIKVDAETAVGGFVNPGDHVDIMLTQGRNETLRAVTILQNVRVIGVDQDAGSATDVPGVARTVTVEVTPVDGQKLALAQQAGRLSLALRTLDSTKADEPLASIKLSDVLQDISPLPEGVKAPTIIVRRGTEVLEETVR